MVSDEYQKQGISGMMIDWVIAKARDRQVCAIVSEATGLYSQSILTKRNFQCWNEILYDQYRREEDGQLVFQHTEPHKSLKLMVLQL